MTGIHSTDLTTQFGSACEHHTNGDLLNVKAQFSQVCALGITADIAADPAVRGSVFDPKGLA